MSANFKECPCCHETWKDYTDFAFDPTIDLIGTQPNIESPLEGHFVFTHNKTGCLSTFLVQIKEFLYINTDIYTFSKFIQSTKDCNGFCKDLGSFNTCSHPHCKSKQIKKIRTILNTRDRAIIKKLDSQ